MTFLTAYLPGLCTISAPFCAAVTAYLSSVNLSNLLMLYSSPFLWSGHKADLRFHLACLLSDLKKKPPRMNFLITFSHRRVIEYADGVNSLNSSMSLWHHTVLQNCDCNFIFMRQLVTLITTCFLCQYNWKPMEQFHTFSQSFLCAATFQKMWGLDILHSLTASLSF